MDNINREIGKRIRAVRESQGLTQTELGQMLGVEKASVSKYEAGEAKRGVPVDFLIKIAELGKVSLDHLLTGKDSTALKPRQIQIPPELVGMVSASIEDGGAQVKALSDGAILLGRAYDQLPPEGQLKMYISIVSLLCDDQHGGITNNSTEQKP